MRHRNPLAFYYGVRNMLIAAIPFYVLIGCLIWKGCGK